MARYALVIGIAKYDNFDNLPKTVNDAAQITQLLREHGRFDVQPLPRKLIESENSWQVTPDKKLTGQELGQALNTFLLEKAKGAEALIYFAGHGFEATSNTGVKKGYLATSDCAKDGVKAIAFDDFNTLISKSQLSSLVVLLDCCYAGSLLERSFINSSFPVFNSKTDYCLITASRAFERAREDAEGGIFTQAVLKGLASSQADEARGEINVNDLISFISRELKDSGQEPIYMGGGRSIPLVWYPPRNPVAVGVVSEECPYRGLEAFEKQHAKFFFGRQKVVNYIQQKLAQANFVPIIGASGSGKSSVVRAGLIPVLEKNGWRILEPILPGVEPLAELKRAFTQLFERTKIREISALIDTEGLSSVISQLTGSERCLLVVDQFEEIFTLGAKEEEKQRFIELLTQVDEGRLAIVTTMRADFLEYCLSYESLTQLIQEQAVYMPPLLGAELEEAIASPAMLQGYQLERGLLGAIQQEVLGQEKGCLPLLQFALTELWEQRDRTTHQLTVAKFNALGGVIGALNRHAEQMYAGFSEQQQAWVKRIFLKLVRTGAADKDTRQRQPKQELLSLAGENSGNQEATSDILEQLIQSRLLVCDTENTGEIWVDLAHEALMEGWEQFAEWRKENRPLRRLINLVEDAFQEWVKNPQEENLMMGGLLNQVRKQWTPLELNISPPIVAFCQLSMDTEVQLRYKSEVGIRIRDEFLAVISHELRTPLNAILGWSQLLQSRKLNEVQTKQGLKTIERNARFQTQLIEDLLDISRLEQGRMRLNITTCDLVSVIKEAMETVHLAAEAKDIKIQAMLNLNSINVLGDPLRLQQVMWNLLSNAVKFTPSQGQIQINLQKTDVNVAITVSDTGEGIKPEFLPHIFDKFRQEDRSVIRRFGGLGLGLAIVRQIVELHGGTVSANSPGEGKGATFIVNLPMKAVS
ncbi:signal transduction histidine kinase [Nostoc sp. PCC 7524]|uniref:nSTAND1 domain-containing NTPase n=1 Tax=Nostoc sp. (strain ATCC 29411 / PCC 7524) TaxID=28072 RepID=UPI00029F319B|nr:ATP-binding protein [Nostoc sp. PCC 7524]AFY48304.1 signal transduction histidine kinase [Nostoc sp. PCC 7524]